MTQKKFTALVSIEKKSLPDKEPLFLISNNGKICQSEFEAEFGLNRLEITLQNKNPDDTKIDKNGNIFADLNIHIKGFTVDGFDLTNHFQNQCVYVTEDGKIEKTHGFLHKNGTVNFEFVCPPFLFIRNLSLIKNSEH